MGAFNSTEDSQEDTNTAKQTCNGIIKNPSQTKKTSLKKENLTQLKHKIGCILDKQPKEIMFITEKIYKNVNEELLAQILVNFSMQAGLRHLEKSSPEYRDQNDMIFQVVMLQVLSNLLLPPFHEYFSQLTHEMNSVDIENQDEFAKKFENAMVVIKQFENMCLTFFVEILNYVAIKKDKRIINFVVASAIFNISQSPSIHFRSYQKTKDFLQNFFLLFERYNLHIEKNLQEKFNQLQTHEIESAQIIKESLQISSFLQFSQSTVNKLITGEGSLNFISAAHTIQELFQKYYKLVLPIIDIEHFEDSSKRIFLNITFLNILNTPGLFSFCSFINIHLNFLLSAQDAHSLSLIMSSYQQINNYMNLSKESKEFPNSQPQQEVLENNSILSMDMESSLKEFQNLDCKNPNLN